SCQSPDSLWLLYDPAPSSSCRLSLHDALPISTCAGDCTSPCVTCVRRWPSCWWAPKTATAFTSSIRTAAKRPRIASLTVSISTRSEEHTSELQSRENLVCRLLLVKKNLK